MVGVGGRSKACDNCKRRHIKCDLTLPQCRRCIIAKLHCGGIQNLAILQYDGRKNITNRVAIDASITAESDGRLVAKAQRSSPQTTPVTWRWNFRPLRRDVFMAYTNSRLFHGVWSAVVPDEEGQPLTNTCLVALSTTFFGLEHRDNLTIKDGLSVYTTALRTLNQSLSDPFQSRTLDTLQSVIVMTLFELLSSDQEHGWLSHSRGLEKLFALHGAEAVTKLPFLVLFEKSRSNMIFSALLSRERTVFSTSEWKYVPWRFFPGRIDSMKTLQDVLADCTDLFYIRGTMQREISMTDIRMAEKFNEQACNIITELESWKDAWASSPAYIHTEVPVSDTSRSGVTRQRAIPPWSSILRYKSFYHANVIVLYHGIKILVHMAVQETRAAMGLGMDENTGDIIHEAGLTICRSVDYHLDAIWGSAGSLIILFPLRMALKAVGNSDLGINAWLRETLASIASGSAGRWNYAQHILGVARPVQ